ncbi:DUF3261 domain-containing protein [Acinetobacter pragensis]
MKTCIENRRPMEPKLPLKIASIILASAVLCSGCQSLVPKAQGLTAVHWIAQRYQRQDQIEVQWKTQSFSFLLYQQQNGQQLEMLALSLTGQQLFKLSFDGQRVKVEQHIEQMKLLPFEYVARDLLYATYPDFAALQEGQVFAEQKNAEQTIYIQQHPVLRIVQQNQAIELNNLQVPYQMFISPVSNTLENDGDSHDPR